MCQPPAPFSIACSITLRSLLSTGEATDSSRKLSSPRPRLIGQLLESFHTKPTADRGYQLLSQWLQSPPVALRSATSSSNPDVIWAVKTVRPFRVTVKRKLPVHFIEHPV